MALARPLDTGNNGDDSCCWPAQKWRDASSPGARQSEAQGRPGHGQKSWNVSKTSTRLDIAMSLALFGDVLGVCSKTVDFGGKQGTRGTMYGNATNVAVP